MISVLKTGSYQVVESERGTRLLVLEGKRIFIWMNMEGAGQILIVSRLKHKKGTALATGKYRLYDVREEPEFTDFFHLELLVCRGAWQGYLLPTGLPNEKERKKKIVPTDERITCAHSRVVCPLYFTRAPFAVS